VAPDTVATVPPVVEPGGVVGTVVVVPFVRAVLRERWWVAAAAVVGVTVTAEAVLGVAAAGDEVVDVAVG
jgi:hypothetical protein